MLPSISLGDSIQSDRRLLVTSSRLMFALIFAEGARDDALNGRRSWRVILSPLFKRDLGTQTMEVHVRLSYCNFCLTLQLSIFHKDEIILIIFYSDFASTNLTNIHKNEKWMPQQSLRVGAHGMHREGSHGRIHRMHQESRSYGYGPNMHQVQPPLHHNAHRAGSDELLEDWPRRMSDCSANWQDWQGTKKIRQPRVTFSESSSMQLHHLDQLYAQTKSYSKDDCQRFSRDSQMEAVRIQNLVVSSTLIGASTKESFKNLLKNEAILPEEIRGIEHLVLYRLASTFTMDAGITQGLSWQCCIKWRLW